MASYSCKDLILLQKYKDDTWRSALVEMTVSKAKWSIFAAATLGETSARISCHWASSKEEYDSLQKQEQLVRERLKETFKDANVTVDAQHMNFFITEYWELVILVRWGGL
jgi:hypothetical protein